MTERKRFKDIFWGRDTSNRPLNPNWVSEFIGALAPEDPVTCPACRSTLIVELNDFRKCNQCGNQFDQGRMDDIRAGLKERAQQRRDYGVMDPGQHHVKSGI
jgi:hypothetical protein